MTLLGNPMGLPQENPDSFSWCKVPAVIDLFPTKAQVWSTMTTAATKNPFHVIPASVEVFFTVTFPSNTINVPSSKELSLTNSLRNLPAMADGSAAIPASLLQCLRSILEAPMWPCVTQAHPVASQPNQKTRHTMSRSCELQNILSWEGSIRIINSNSWPYTGHFNNPTPSLRAFSSCSSSSGSLGTMTIPWKPVQCPITL